MLKNYVNLFNLIQCESFTIYCTSPEEERKMKLMELLMWKNRDGTTVLL